MTRYVFGDYVVVSNSFELLAGAILRDFIDCHVNGVK